MPQFLLIVILAMIDLELLVAVTIQDIRILAVQFPGVHFLANQGRFYSALSSHCILIAFESR